jgi:N-acetylglutamate synthase-like GNAT family acetyltransferase
MKARRATVEDLPQLIELWRLEQLPAETLERRLTDFQVVVDEAQVILGAIALQTSANHGWLHAEAIARSELADQIRQLLWERLQRVAVNHSLDRIWTQLPFAFWRNIGFRPAKEDEMASFPEAFGDKAAGWQIARLREGDASADAIEKQFAMLRALHAEESGRFKRHVVVLKRVATGLTVIVFLLIIAWAVTLFRYGPKFFQR